MSYRDFTYRVTINGTQLQNVTLEDATIEYGRRDPNEAVRSPVCTLRLLTDYGTNIWSSIGDLAEMTLDVDTESGYVDTYADVYAGETFRRFTGHVIAKAYDPLTQICTVTLVGNSEKLARQLAKTSTYSAQTDVQRATTILGASGLAYTIDGTATVNLNAITQAAPVSALSYMSDIATWGGALLYETVDGTIVYRTPNATANVVGAFPPNAVGLAGSQMTRETGDVLNQIIVSYGTASPQATYTGTSTGSQTSYGVRGQSYTTELSNSADATAMANVLLASYAYPAWSMPNVEVHVDMLALPDASVVLSYRIGDIVTVTNLPSDAPVSSYTSTILGWSERLGKNYWSTSFHIASEGWTQSAIRWTDIPGGAGKKWNNVTAGVSWNDALTLTRIGF